MVRPHHSPASSMHQQPTPSPLANKIRNGAEHCPSPMCHPCTGPPQPITINTHAKTHSLKCSIQAHAPYSIPASPAILPRMFKDLRMFAKGNSASPSSLPFPFPRIFFQTSEICTTQPCCSAAQCLALGLLTALQPYPRCIMCFLAAASARLANSLQTKSMKPITLPHTLAPLQRNTHGNNHRIWKTLASESTA